MRAIADWASHEQVCGFLNLPVLPAPAMRSKAEELGRKLQAEDGVAEAVRIIERRFG